VQKDEAVKKEYSAPTLVVFGKVVELTKGGGNGSFDGNGFWKVSTGSSSSKKK
jgi:hypothetical protein